ncbi:MAG TPA: IPT/TIG domain-containing protein [Bryobacteraceae bacterium]|nr:IPT/TIG domain-containing protein [Bryobacteraceae bacterium]
MTLRPGWFLFLLAIPVFAGPMALNETRYTVGAGEPVQLLASSDATTFLLNAKTRTTSVDGLTIAPNRNGDQILLAASLRTKPGDYTATLTATSATGEQQQTTVTVRVKPRQTVPTGSTRPPVVLLNGWETGYTNSCPLSSDSSVTFGNLAQYLKSDGVPVVYFFDNCAEDANQPIETLGNDLGKFLTTITYDNGTQVPQIDLVAFSMGGLIARSYLAGLQTNGSLTPPATTLVRDLILIATPNFGSFVATNYASSIQTGSQSAEIITASGFLWNLSMWNQHVDDLRGVNAIAVIGNAGSYISNANGTNLTNASDGIVSTTSASLGFLNQNATLTRIVPYCQIDPGAFTNQNLATFNCNAPGIANITDQEQPTGEIVRSFLAGTSAWQSIGSTPATDPLLSTDGGTFFAVVNQKANYLTDVTQVQWGTLLLQVGGDQGTIYFNDFVSGTGLFTANSQSLGSIDCGNITEAIGYFAAARCKIATAIISVGPLITGSARIIASGAAITITGADFGFNCNGCKVVANGTALSISSWTSTSITARLPSNLSGLVSMSVQGVNGTDNINIMVAAPAAASTISLTPTTLQFAASAGGTAPAAQTIQIANTGTGTLAWTATATVASGGSWLSVTPTSGAAGGSASVSVSIDGLNAGTYNGTVQIASPGASNTPQTVAVTLIITGAPPALSVTPQTLSFQYTVGGATPDPQSVSITNTGGGTLSWTASASDFWLGASSASGSGPATLSISVNPANLAAGTYTGTVQINASGAAGSPASVSVTLVVQGTQPAGSVTGAANAASFQPAVASATWFAIFGTNLSATTYSWQASDFVNGQLPTSLHGVSVTINGNPAYIDYISPTQINVLAPDDTATGSVPLVITTAGQQSNSINVQKQQYTPAFFTFGSGTAVAQHAADYSLIDATSPAKAGEEILLYGTGFGPTTPALPTGQLITTPEPLPGGAVQIQIGGASANVAFAGLVEPGLYQFNVTIPANTPSGNAVLAATIGGVQTQTGVSIPIQ